MPQLHQIAILDQIIKATNCMIKTLRRTTYGTSIFIFK